MKRRVSLAIVLCLVAGLVVPGVQGISVLATKTAAVSKSEGEADSEAVVEATFTDESEVLTEEEEVTEVTSEPESETETETETEVETESESETETESETEEDSIVGELIFAQCEDYINIREEKSLDGEVTAKIYNNCAATVLAVEDEWYEISSGNAQGYVLAEYFATGEAAAAIAEEVAYNVAQVQVEYLNIRAEASTDSEVIDVAKEGDELEVVLYGEEWMEVFLGEDIYGYISSEYVEYITYYPVAETLEEEEARLIAEGLLDASTLETETPDEAGTTSETEAATQTTTSTESSAQAEASTPVVTQTEAAQTEATQTEVAQTEAESQTEATQTEVTQTEAVQTEAAQTEAAQTEAAQTENESQTEATAATEAQSETETVTAASAPAVTEEAEEVVTETDDAEEDEDSEGYYDADTDTYYDGNGNVISTASSVNEETVQTEAPQTEAAQTETESTTGSESSASIGEAIAEYALQFVGYPYVYGGTSLTEGADCSGFVQSVFANFGIYLSRTAAAQATNGTIVSNSEVQAGDLFFYSSTGDGTIDHVAIYIGNGRIVHAANSTRGICTDSAYYTTPVCIVRCY